MTAISNDFWGSAPLELYRQHVHNLQNLARYHKQLESEQRARGFILAANHSKRAYDQTRVELGGAMRKVAELKAKS